MSYADGAFLKPTIASWTDEQLSDYAVPYVLRILYMADLMIGAALWNARQTGLDRLPAVREKLADLVCYREGINAAHIVAAIAEA